MRVFRAIAVLLVLFCAVGALHGSECPEDSLPNGTGGCTCKSACPAHKCSPGQHQILVRTAAPETPGSCCPTYDCVTAVLHGSESCPEDSVPTNDGRCKCVPTCPPPTCRSGQRPVQVRPGIHETPGSCCPLYECVPSESVSWVDTDDGNMPGNCIHQGVSRKLDERWKPSACENCVCEEKGFVRCVTSMCKSCENSIPPGPDECCPHCPPFTNSSILDVDRPCRSSFSGCTLRCEHGYTYDENNCPKCECAQRQDTTNAVTPLTTSDDDGKICPELTHCMLKCDLAKDEGGCSVCACQQPDSQSASTNDSSIAVLDENQRKVCPEVNCELHCERGLVMDENDCTFCECKPPSTGCPPMSSCKKKCPVGYKTNRRGCPICRCRASCTDHQNQTHPEGATWYPNTCMRCTCDFGGRLSCKETICSVACRNPLPPKPGACCPYCPITVTKLNETIPHHVARGWGTVPITLICVLALLCLLLMVHIVRNRFRGRLSPSEASYSSYPPQYYKCVPVYDTPAHRSEKIVPL